MCPSGSVLQQIHPSSSIPANSSWGGHSQVLHLKHHMHRAVELDTLAVCQTEHLVVVQHSVHVLNPQSIHWTITYDPLVILSCVLHSRN